MLNGNNQVWDATNVFVTDGACMASSAIESIDHYMALTARAAAFAVEAISAMSSRVRAGLGSGKCPGAREFLGALGAAGPPGSSGRPARRSGWEVGFGETRPHRDSALYRRRELAKDVEGTLARVAEIGYKEVEFAGYPEGTAQSLRALLDRHGVRAPSSHVGLGSLRRDWARTLDQAAAVGQKFVIVAFVPQDQRRTLDDWKQLAALFNKAGEESRARGLQFGYHNHDFEFTPSRAGSRTICSWPRRIPRSSSGAGLYWITKAGHDPLAYFAKWPGRFPLVHVKDMDATARRAFTPIGQGTIDFASIFRKAKQGGITHYFYEQDEVQGSPFDAAKQSYDYLRALTF